MTKDVAFTSHNNANLCGKIVKKITKKNETIFILSCGYGKKPKYKEDGKIDRNLVAVYFFDELSKHYNKRFEQDDFVTVSGVVQTVRDHYNGTYFVTIWGLSMGPKKIRGKVINDQNFLEIRGKIESVKVINSNYMIINVLTKVEKKYKNPNEDSSVKKITQKFKSVTPIGVRCYKNAKALAKTKYTPGTWIDVKGFMYGKNDEKNKEKTFIKRAISTKISIIGEIQPYKVL